MLEKIVEEFFIKRFNRQPKDDIVYFEEWIRRFKTGNPKVYMDSKSKHIWDDIVKNL